MIWRNSGRSARVWEGIALTQRPKALGEHGGTGLYDNSNTVLLPKPWIMCMDHVHEGERRRNTKQTLGEQSHWGAP